MRYFPNKQDLNKLKHSKPIQLICHTNECVVPVVYSGLVNKFLESKGITLPLTHHQLADFKRQAGMSGYQKKETEDEYAKGEKSLKKKKSKKKGHSVSVVVNNYITRRGGTNRVAQAQALQRTINIPTYHSIPTRLPSYDPVASKQYDSTKFLEAYMKRQQEEERVKEKNRALLLDNAKNSASSPWVAPLIPPSVSAFFNRPVSYETPAPTRSLWDSVASNSREVFSEIARLFPDDNPPLRVNTDDTFSSLAQLEHEAKYTHSQPSSSSMSEDLPRHDLPHDLTKQEAQEEIKRDLTNEKDEANDNQQHFYSSPPQTASPARSSRSPERKEESPYSTSRPLASVSSASSSAFASNLLKARDNVPLRANDFDTFSSPNQEDSKKFVLSPYLKPTVSSSSKAKPPIKSSSSSEASVRRVEPSGLMSVPARRHSTAVHVRGMRRQNPLIPMASENVRRAPVGSSRRQSLPDESTPPLFPAQPLTKKQIQARNRADTDAVAHFVNRGQPVPSHLLSSRSSAIARGEELPINVYRNKYERTKAFESRLEELKKANPDKKYKGIYLI